MELSSPYLQAIQAIPGTVPGEKYRQLNLIAKERAAGRKGHGDSATGALIADVPEPLQPLVQLEMAKVQRNYEGVVEALKSEDSVVSERALSQRWFFRGDDERVISVDYFDENVLPYVSLNTRDRLIKRLASNLRASGKTRIANEFYAHLVEMYDRKQAEPLLVACDETFIYDTITKNKMVLSCCLVKTLFARYPKLVIRYMKLAKTNDDRSSCDESSSSYDINLALYNLFLPRLIKNHPDDFVELITKHDSSLGIRLSNKATATLLKSHVEAVLLNPVLWKQLMSLKVIASKLTKPQYKSMFLKLLPEDKRRFNYDAVKQYVEYYPEQERLDLILDSYKQVYGSNLLDNAEAIDVEFMRMLPTDERIKQARIKLTKEPDWRKNRYDVQRAWRCYLPIEESIPSIKNEITKTSSADDRSSLLSQMFYSCKVNDDKDALLSTLRYFTKRHRNEQSNVVFAVLGNLTDYFDLSTLGEDHWNVLNDFVDYLRMKNALMTRQTITKKIFVAGVLYNLNHDLPIDEKMTIIMEINVNVWKQSWSIFPKHPEYDRLCLDMFFTMIPQKYSKDNDLWKNRQHDVILSIVREIYDFNTRNARANCTIDKMSIKSYPWLLERVRNIVQSEGLSSNSYQVHDIISILKIHEKELYKQWIVIDVQEIVNVETGEALTRLTINSQNILDNWTEYLKLARLKIHHPTSQRFVRATRWYQDIPIKFADQCRRDIANDRDANSIVILGILVEGPELARIAEPFVPKISTQNDQNDENPNSKGPITRDIPRAINLSNPPVPLSLIMHFCVPDYLDLCLTSLTNVSRRVNVQKVQSFAKSLTDLRVSVKKHGIRLFSLVSTITDLREFLRELWNNEHHRTIRAIVFEYIFKIFTVRQTNAENWEMMKNCIDSLTINDDDCVKKLVNLDAISERFIDDYVDKLLSILEKLETNGFGAERTSNYVSEIIRKLNAKRCRFLSDDLSEKLIRQFFFNPIVSDDVRSSAIRFVIRGYLGNAQEKLDCRLTKFCKLFEDNLRKNWNVPHPDDLLYFPINDLTHEFMTNVGGFNDNDKDTRIRIMESVLESFLTVLKPKCDWIAYAALVYEIALKDAKTRSDIVEVMMTTLRPLIDALSPEMVTMLPEVAIDCIKSHADDDEVQPLLMDLIEGLCKTGDKHACLFAAEMLFFSDDRKFDERLFKVYEFLRESEHDGVACLAYRRINVSTRPRSQ